MRLLKFLQAFFWEFVQNLPLITGAIVALDLWQLGRWEFAVACLVSGNVVGAFVIRVTESKIVEGHREPLRVTIVNIAVMTLLAIAFLIYFSQDWSNWKTDLVLGATAGLGGAVAQDIAAGTPIGFRHSVALGFAAPIVSIGIRVLVAATSIPVSVLIITTVVTLIISSIDYNPFSIER